MTEVNLVLLDQLGHLDQGVTQAILEPQEKKEILDIRGQQEQRAILETLGHLESREM